ncbi:MAG: glycosyltransferase involved in cell wall biosynthesis [Cocleimonas sp.]|jgi:glycosyltransferase involved in cell wall biosynthesis
MNVLMVHQSSELYGSDRSFVSSCKAMHELGNKVTVILPSSGPLCSELDVYCDSLIIHDFGVLRKTALRSKPFKEIVKLIAGVHYAIKLVKNFDMVYVNTIVNITFIIALFLYRGKKIIHVREMPLGLINKVFGLFLNISKAKLIYNSFSVKKSFKLEGDVIYNGVACARVNTDVNVDVIDKKPLKILFVGRLNDWKGADLLLQAAKVLDHKGIILSIDLLGDCYPGQERFVDELILLKNKIENISINLLGFVDDTSFVYSQCDLVVVPSRQPEPFGRVVIEAMAHKKVVLIANHGGMAELIEDGINGYKFEPNNVSSLANVIDYIYNNYQLRNTVVSNAFASYETSFTEEAYIKNIKSLVLSC